MPQAEIERLLVEHGSAGRDVVRLKGGDPFVFGRGGEEAEALREAGIPFTIVPGVTAGVAAAAVRGDPGDPPRRGQRGRVRDRPRGPGQAGVRARLGCARGVPGDARRLHGGPAAGGDHRAADRRRAGRPTSPRRSCERGTLPGQRTVRRNAGERSPRSRPPRAIRAPRSPSSGRSPAARAARRGSHRPPLYGVTVAVTRARAQASGLAARLRALGAEVIEAPAIRIVALDGPAPDLDRYDLVCLTSPNGVRLLFARLARAGLDARGVRRGARRRDRSGDGGGAPATTGSWPTSCPSGSSPRASLEALAGIVPAPGARSRGPREARDVLPDALRDARCRGRRRRAVRDRRRAAQRRAARRGRRRRLRHLHVVIDGAVLPRRRR